MNTGKILEHFSRKDPVIYTVMKTMDFSKWIGKKKTTRLEYFRSLCRQIISQQLSGKAADTIQTRFEELFPEKNITPETLLKIEDQTLRDAGMSWAKVSYVKNIATEILGNRIRWSDFEKFNDENIICELIKIKGIGRWTAEMFLMFTLGREDIFSHGDLGLKRGIERLYHLKNPSPKKIETITSIWKPYRSYGSISLWQSLEK
ncbi:hypothetical protein COV58_00970 [Candidatus Roizmanbacteria bacterium CG11_big_fil_rev_8_21_14_0_20_36_8]|uniref:DNA-3-methyladenine glycosylase II n=2 Tax=Candidatus Roizmaniibacteriota TaxID=1752723 RepID=A0A2M6IUW6_9BACT|nr:MAG: hypothetical protein COV58_00970 [Candidatus Roizmanbacteria bacterium CG11_big_fil_rev_8_21_14_0_20_36_8]PIZ63404.1 MAG: DNA-3-methyladenine glycosylase 2 family protein [Candidatus Roizmanbacteria bacterium CG_4_10_14_0_2_um_filter_39_13]